MYVKYEGKNSLIHLVGAMEVEDGQSRSTKVLELGKCKIYLIV